MIPESIKAEIEGKGGLAGPPEPQGNGTTIYRAVSGDYVVVNDATGQLAMRGFSPPAEGAAPVTSPIAQQPTAPVAPPGAGAMNQQQLEALLKQVAPNADPSRLVFSQGMKAKTVTTGTGIMATSKTVQVPWVKWVDPGTGRVVEADVEEGGTYTVTKNAVERSAQGAPATKPEGQQAGTKEGDTRGPQNGPTREVFEGGKWVVKPNPVYQAPKPEKPGAPTIKPDGRGGSIAVQTMPDGTIKTTPLPGVPSDTTRITVDGVVYEKGPDGQFAPARGIPLPGATAKNVDAFTPDYTKPDLGLGAWANAQRQKIGTPAEQGGITQSEYDSAVKAAHDQASVEIQNVTSNQTVRRQQEQDERTQRLQLSGQSAADYATARSAFDANLQYMNPDKPGIDSYIPAIMAEQQRFRQQREAAARPATPLHPMFQAMPAAAGVSPPPVVTVPPPAAPAAPPAATVAPPVAPAPSVAPAQTVASPPPAQAGAPVVQPMIPASVIRATTDTTHGLIDDLVRPDAPPVPPVSATIERGTGIAPPDQGVVSADIEQGTGIAPTPPETTPTPEPQVTVRNRISGETVTMPQSQWDRQGTLTRAVWLPVPSTGEPAAPEPAPVQPSSYGEGGDAPVSAAPSGGLVSAWANPLLAPQPEAPGGQPVLNLQQPAAAPSFDPFPVAGKLAQMGLPADAVAQAMMELGMVPQQGGGVA